MFLPLHLCCENCEKQCTYNGDVCNTFVGHPLYSECASEEDEADNDQPDEDVHLKAVLSSYIADHYCSVCVFHVDTSSKLYGDLYEHASVDDNY